MDCDAARNDKFQRTASLVLSEGRASRQAGRQDVLLRLAHHSAIREIIGQIVTAASSTVHARHIHEADVKTWQYACTSHKAWRPKSMLYWLGVYSFVVIAVLLPFVLLYTVVVLSWLGVAAIRFLAPIRIAFSRKQTVSHGTAGARAS